MTASTFSSNMVWKYSTLLRRCICSLRSIVNILISLTWNVQLIFVLGQFLIWHTNLTFTFFMVFPSKMFTLR